MKIIVNFEDFENFPQRVNVPCETGHWTACKGEGVLAFFVCRYTAYQKDVLEIGYEATGCSTDGYSSWPIATQVRRVETQSEYNEVLRLLKNFATFYYTHTEGQRKSLIAAPLPKSET